MVGVLLAEVSEGENNSGAVLSAMTSSGADVGGTAVAEAIVAGLLSIGELSAG